MQRSATVIPIRRRQAVHIVQDCPVVGSTPDAMPGSGFWFLLIATFIAPTPALIPEPEAILQNCAECAFVLRESCAVSSGKTETLRKESCRTRL
jgi:hypothetical protein